MIHSPFPLVTIAEINTEMEYTLTWVPECLNLAGTSQPTHFKHVV